MGRWAQRNRRGGGPAEPVAPVPPPLAVVSVGVQAGLDRVVIDFDGPPTITLDAPDAAFTVDGLQFDLVVVSGGSQVTANISPVSSQVVPWDLNAQPNWLVNAVTFPVSGSSVPV